jgi:predicted RNA binding protein YcfA (HicA-like mRNA interferase family)
LSPRLPRVNVNEVIRVLEKIGFVLTRQSGSHKIYKNDEGRRATVAYHGSTILKPKTLKSILNDANLTVEEFIDLLND